jgi:hypothetical protein
MSIEFLVIAAPIFMAVTAVLVAFVSQWLNDRAERRKAR